jgi:hypothetical protein
MPSPTRSAERGQALDPSERLIEKREDHAELGQHADGPDLPDRPSPNGPMRVPKTRYQHAPAPLEGTTATAARR